METSSFNIEKMSVEMGISVVIIKKTLGISHTQESNNNITSIEQARNAYMKATVNSEEAYFAFEKWNELSMEEVRIATTSLEARNAYTRVLSGSKAEYFALKKWIELSQNEVDLAHTPEETRDAYNRVPNDSEAKKIALKKIASFFGWKCNA